MMTPKPPGCVDCLRTRLHLLPIITFTWLAITVCLSYLLAAIKRDTEAGFPYISKTANDDPQRAIFAQMVTIGSVLYGMCSTMRYLSLKADLVSCSVPGGYHRLNIIGLITGLSVCLGNSLLANFPTDGYSGNFKTPHYIGAALAFVGGVVYGWIQTRLSWLLDRKQRKTSRIQMVLMIWTTLTLVTFGISKIIYEVQKSKGYGTKEDSLRDVYLSSTVTEWILAFSVAGFPLTFVPDFRASILRSPRVIRRNYLEEIDDMDAPSTSGHRMPPGGAMDILFSFDTTGSMSYILDEVKGRLSDMIQRLQADIPGIRLGVIAHGDYCDEEVFYLEKHIDFTQNVVDLCNFVGGVEGTGGGDQDECYELILRKAHQEFTWAPVSNKVLVMIGDANPHPPDYKLNVDNIDWKKEVASIAKKGIKIYAVQAQNNDGVEDFYESMAEETGGHYLRLENFSNICDFIMAICYRERDDDLFTNYEAEVAARQGTSGFHKDLNNMFATLRREDSKLSNISSTSKPDQAIPVSTKLIGRRGSYSSDSGTSSSGCSSAEPSGTVHRYGSFSSVSSASSSTPNIPAAISPLSPMTPTSNLFNTKTSNGNSQSRKPHKSRISKKTSSKKRNTIPREKVPQTRFALRNLKWSSWKLAYTPDKPDDSQKWRKMNKINGYRRKTLFHCSTDQKVYEVSVQTHPGGKLHVMYQTVTSSNLNSLNWCHCLFAGSLRRYRVHDRQVIRVIEQGCRVFVRKADVKKRQMKMVDKLTKYSYAWTRSITGKRTPERTVVKNDKTLSGMDYSIYMY